MMSGFKEGGLNIETPMIHAHKRKLRIILRGLSKGGMTGIHIENLLRMELEKAGCGGLPDQNIQVEVTTGEAGYVTSLIQWLDEVGLAIHLPWLVYNSPFAHWVRVGNSGRRTRGPNPHLVMEGEVDRPENRGKGIPIRVGQSWVVEGGVFEISSISRNSVEGVKWNGLGKRLVEGAVVTREGTYEVTSVPTNVLRKINKIGLMEDMPKRVKGKAKRVRRLLEREPMNPTLTVPPYAGREGLFEGFEFDEVYTDGSWKEKVTTRSFLSGEKETTTGGAVVLRKGEKFLLIHIEMDIELESAFEAEMISLLTAVDIVRDREATIYSDCKSALSLLNNQMRGAFLNITSGWKKPVGTVLKKVRAHPERYKKPEDWNGNDKGIWLADQVAGGTLVAEKNLRASAWMKRISYSSRAIVVDKKTGTPFFREVSKRWSKHLMSRYFEERDDYRMAEGENRIWKGTNISHAYRMMGKRRGLADRAAVQRLGLNKRWRWHWARDDKTCPACGDPSVGIKHPLRLCKNVEVIEERERWKNNVEECLRGIPAKHRAPLEDLWSCMQRGSYGEYACCGVFLPGFLSKLDKAEVAISKKDVARLKRLTRVVGRGAREVLRVQTEQNTLSRAVDLRQLSIKDFLTDVGPRGEAATKTKRAGAASLSDDKSDASSDKEAEYGSDAEGNVVKLRYPIKAGAVIKNFLLSRWHLGGGLGRVKYWEFKAG